MNREREPLNPKTQLDLISNFIMTNHNASKYSEYEMEAKFGTRGIKPITKMDYDNVVKYLKSTGYVTNNETGSYSLKIQPEFLDTNTGKYKTSADMDRFRVEIMGLDNIQEYCKTNNVRQINEKSGTSVLLLRKTDVLLSQEKDSVIRSADFDDFNFRVSLKNEETISKTGKLGGELFEKWNNTKKNFRYINRVSFKHANVDEYPFQIDLSIVRSSSKNERGWMIQTYNVAESGVFQNPETYEIEVEVLPFARTKFRSAKELSDKIQKVIKSVLCGLQKTNYPVSYPEQKDTIRNYHQLLFEEEYEKRGEKYSFGDKTRVYPSDFLGPSLVTLGVKNIAPLNSDVIIPNITEPYAYCVTEKADGERNLLYVNPKGKIYLINMNMTVVFTGAKTQESACFNSLLDGELILHNKKGQFINTFTAFDIYYVNKVDVRSRAFMKVPSTKGLDKDSNKDKDELLECRLAILKEYVKNLKATSVLETVSPSPIKITSKRFYPVFDTDANKDMKKDSNKDSRDSIFEANKFLLKRISDSMFEYEIDGLIFTPTLLGVGSNKKYEAGPKKKITWPYCFKWKPSEATSTFPKSYNTIDFLVVTKKSADGSDVVHSIFEKGINNSESTQYNQYKTLVLAVGFDPNRHGYINPCQDLLDERNDKDDKGSNGSNGSDEGYKPKQFYPSDPYDPNAGLCNIMLEMDNNGTHQMMTEERQVFEDQMVVEFRYDMTKPGLWKWIPMRVRFDKTAEFRAKTGVGANDYNTANNNWSSIHNPVTETMLSTGQNIPSIEISDDVYYNSTNAEKMTQGMRDFHNLFVKKALIQGVSKRGDTLIDFACGKSGDFPKWIGAELSFVFGIDISKDNIENRLNGACARYLNFRKTTKHMPYALFVNGNSSLNIRSGTNMFSDKANEITKSVFGVTGLNKSLGVAVARQHGVGQNGFDVSSCQFAIHYMFENKKTFYSFVRNIAECTRLNGHFIATCYDGQKIFNMLSKKEEGGMEEIYVDDKKVWSVTKQYDATEFDNNESCLGYKIDVYQDSINQTLSEYLVNFEFFKSTMEKYGLRLVTDKEASQMGLPEGSGLFSDLYNAMMNEVQKNPFKKADYKSAIQMKDYERRISFLNRYFIFKKITTINAEKLTKVLLEQLPDEQEFENVGTVLARESVAKAEEAIRPKVKKLREKLVLVQATEAFEEDTKAEVEEKAQAKDKKKKTRKNRKILDVDET